MRSAIALGFPPTVASLPDHNRCPRQAQSNGGEVSLFNWRWGPCGSSSIALPRWPPPSGDFLPWEAKMRLFKTALVAVFCIGLGSSNAKSASDVDPAKFGLSELKYATVYCKSRSDGRKPVWMNTDKGTYALNGQAISWVQKAD